MAVESVYTDVAEDEEQDTAVEAVTTTKRDGGITTTIGTGAELNLSYLLLLQG
jgi:hypothetical protein